MSRRRVLAVPALVVAGTLAGCGGSSSTNTKAASPGPTHAGLVAAAEHICRDAVRAHSSHPFPVMNFDPEHPDPAKLPAVAAYFTRYGDLPRTVAALHRLKPPAADASQWSTLLASVDAAQANAERQRQAAGIRDVSTFVMTLHIGSDLSARIDRAGKVFGFSSESACGQVFG